MLLRRRYSSAMPVGFIAAESFAAPLRLPQHALPCFMFASILSRYDIRLRHAY